MYSIGEFSRINRITPRTLRHYDSLGLLKPARIDSWTGYRYYEAAQMPVIRRILYLKDLGLSLEDIQLVLKDESHLVTLLKTREKELENSIQKDKLRLLKLREFIGNSEGVLKMEKEISVELKELPEVIVASMRVTVPGYDSFFSVVPKMGEYMKSVGAECREPAYCFNIYHDGEYRESDIDVEICEAVTAFHENSDKVKFKTMEGAAQAACMKHQGDYASIGSSYNLLFSWMEENGYIQDGLPRESYIDGIWNKEDPSQWLTEIQIPVK